MLEVHGVDFDVVAGNDGREGIIKLKSFARK